MLQKMKDEIELLSRHVLVIRAVMEHQPIGIMKLSELLDLPFHRIRECVAIDVSGIEARSSGGPSKSDGVVPAHGGRSFILRWASERNTDRSGTRAKRGRDPAGKTKAV